MPYVIEEALADDAIIPTSYNGVCGFLTSGVKSVRLYKQINGSDFEQVGAGMDLLTVIEKETPNEFANRIKIEEKRLRGLETGSRMKSAITQINEFARISKPVSNVKWSRKEKVISLSFI